MASNQEDGDNFLLLKSTERQKKEGAEHPLDTAYVQERNGKLILVAVFDVHLFKTEHISVEVKDDKLFVTAGCDEDKEQVTLHKKMLRTLHLPEQADTKSMHCDVKEGILTVEMPLILPQKSQPVNPSVVPIVTVEGRRKISLQIVIGSDFTIDDLQVHSDGQRLTITASYEAEVGRYGEQVARRELKKEYSLPEHISIENTFYELRPGGTLYVDIFLKDEPGQPNYRCDVTTEDISGSKQ